MFAALPEEEKGALRVTCFAPLLLIDPIAMMSTLVVEIFDRHLGDMKFQFGETIIQMKPIPVCLILGLRVSLIANEFLFVDPKHMTNFRIRRFPKKKNTYGLKEIVDALKQAKLERHQGFYHYIVLFRFAKDVLRLNLLKIILSFLLLKKGRNVWVKYVDLRYQIEVPAIGAAPTISAPVVGAPAIGSSSFATEIRAVVVRVCSQLEEHGKILLKFDDHGKILYNHGKMLKRISMSTVGDSTLPLGDTPLLGQYQFSTPKKTVKHKREGGNKKEDGKRKKAEPRIKKGKGEWHKKVEEADMPNKKKKVEGLTKEAFTDDQFDHQVAPGEGLEVVYDLMVDDDVEVGREVNFKTIWSEYGGDLLEASVNQTTAVSVEEQTPESIYLQASTDQITVVSVEEQTIEVVQTEEVISHQEEDVSEASQVIDVYIKALI
ncbi:hypothetical protein GIB67_027310 [Kingdonia uniflora]|uniref:Uncharacterized protein n=1 Tax=Kingdonia uniflora TaxID=39325 RepID=A0A7J7KYI9_9MAGN|nr:hypothetical protein GIB67_027310 [Kingdonia uniflora]